MRKDFVDMVIEVSKKLYPDWYIVGRGLSLRSIVIIKNKFDSEVFMTKDEAENFVRWFDNNKHCLDTIIRIPNVTHSNLWTRTEIQQIAYMVRMALDKVKHSVDTKRVYSKYKKLLTTERR